MTGMGGMSGGGPEARLLLAAIFAALAVFYALRAVDCCLSAHAPHLLMSAGMLYMVLPVAWQVLPVGLWLAVFGSASTWCVIRTTRRWRRDHHLDLEFAHSELTGCVAMALMLPLFTFPGLDGAALPLTIAMGTYFLAYAVFWAGRVRGAPPGSPVAGLLRRTRVEAFAQVAMGTGMAYMFLVM